MARTSALAAPKVTKSHPCVSLCWPPALLHVVPDSLPANVLCIQLRIGILTASVLLVVHPLGQELVLARGGGESAHGAALNACGGAGEAAAEQAGGKSGGHLCCFETNEVVEDVGMRWIGDASREMGLERSLSLPKFAPQRGSAAPLRPANPAHVTELFLQARRKRDLTFCGKSSTSHAVHPSLQTTLTEVAYEAQTQSQTALQIDTETRAWLVCRIRVCCRIILRCIRGHLSCYSSSSSPPDPPS